MVRVNLYSLFEKELKYKDIKVENKNAKSNEKNSKEFLLAEIAYINSQLIQNSSYVKSIMKGITSFVFSSFISFIVFLYAFTGDNHEKLKLLEKIEKYGIYLLSGLGIVFISYIIFYFIDKKKLEKDKKEFIKEINTLEN